jgi:phosphonate transport system permease protein
MTTTLTETPAGAVTQQRVRPPITRLGVGLGILAVGALVLIVVSWRATGFGVGVLFSGLGDMWTFLRSTLPPHFSSADYSLGHMLGDVASTVSMAVLGTALAMVLSIPLAFLAAHNTTPHPVVRAVARTIVTACRAVPDIIFALIFRDALGIGVLPGILALGLHSIGMLGRLYGDGIEQVPPGPRQAVMASGAGRLQTICASIVPFASPQILSNALYRLDINLRSSVVLGFVGAGGIGFTLQAAMNTLQFQLAIGIVLVMTVLILIMELLSALLRSALIGDDTVRTGRRWISFRKQSRSRGNAMPFDSDRVRPHWTGARVGKASIPYLVLVVLGLAWWDAQVPVSELLSSPGAIAHAVTQYFPPDFTTAGSLLRQGMWESFVTAVMGTFVGGLIALVISFFAARNIANPWVYRVVRVLLVIGRSIPELIVAIMFVVAVGPGVLAGVFALVAGTIAFLAKLMADNLEEANPGPRAAIRSTGAGAGQEVVTAVVPPALPGIVGNLLYMLDVNFRASALLGIVGAGGIGFLLAQTVQTFDYRTTGAIVTTTFVIVLLIEQLSNWARRALN